MNHGPLLLSLQPGQTMQPLTLIQAASLGQLVRPSVGVSPVSQDRTGPAPSRGPLLKIRSAPPVNLQMTQVGGANPLKPAGPPSLPSGSANGLIRLTRCTVVMSVEEFYYGTAGGNLIMMTCLPMDISCFTCQICSDESDNNLRHMQHMMQHSKLIGGGASGDERRVCTFCYRQFSSGDQLQSHLEQVHGPAPSTCICRICEWAFENESTFLNHMKSIHKPGEMPYVCQVCKTAASFQQHLLRHQDKMQHKVEHHRSARRPPQLEGLPPGSKVTIRTYGKPPPLTSGRGRPHKSSSSLIQPINIKRERCPPLQRPPPRKQGRCRAPDISSCCSRAYALHMIHHHVPRSREKALPLHRRPPPCVFVLQCSGCAFRPLSADLMADHLLKNPEHYRGVTERSIKHLLLVPEEESQSAPSNTSCSSPRRSHRALHQTPPARPIGGEEESQSAPSNTSCSSQRRRRSHRALHQTPPARPRGGGGVTERSIKTSCSSQRRRSHRALHQTPPARPEEEESQSAPSNTSCSSQEEESQSAPSNTSCSSPRRRSHRALHQTPPARPIGGGGVTERSIKHLLLVPEEEESQSAPSNTSCSSQRRRSHRALHQTPPARPRGGGVTEPSIIHLLLVPEEEESQSAPK
ncbi:Pogo transposable element with ZNF domain [Dissostichus eleginoides]|uniref:Pogo transposable element with ZNF domain n=1 Tax=Dissostichus eleginoides TaxID=100907 RepID=A0AAD9C7A6_DISEL|nr:Pogo transposable element with ZNF domain [Dissostichus eleginoides]